MFGSQISLAEDALSVYYSTDSSTDCSSLQTTPSTASSNSSVRRSSGVLGFLKLNLLGFGAHVDHGKDDDVINGIMKCFRADDLAGMQKFIEVPQDEDEYWWDDAEFSMGKTELKPKSALTPSVRKTVRFEMDFTPENKESRPFTPLFTSTPKQSEVLSDEEEPVQLHDCDSITALPPVLLGNISVMESWNKSREQTVQALQSAASEPMHYRICYDDTDEEEVAEDEVEEATERHTLTVVNPVCENSFQSDTSTDSSVVLGLDRIEDYIRSLEDEMETAKRYMGEQHVNRAHGAVRNAQILQERLCQMHEVISEMCGKWGDGDRHGVSAVFENSCWAAKLDGQQL